MGIFRVIIKESGAGGTGKPPHDAHTGEEAFMLQVFITQKTAVWLQGVKSTVTAWNPQTGKLEFSVLCHENEKIYFPYISKQPW